MQEDKMNQEHIADEFLLSQGHTRLAPGIFSLSGYFDSVFIRKGGKGVVIYPQGWIANFLKTNSINQLESHDGKWTEEEWVHELWRIKNESRD
jgi:hypothetical protein